MLIFRGDVIAEVDGRPISVVRDVLECIKMEIGQTMQIRVRRPVEIVAEEMVDTPVFLTLTTEHEPAEKNQ
jgi:C-terminal processing protease CtpA/Prc